jgi:hypothetical protein
MRLLLAFLVILPVWAQPQVAATDQQAKPDAPAAQAPAPAPAQTAAAAESPAPSTEPWITGSVYLGYRTMTDIRGSFEEYRSVVDLGEGPKLLDLSFSIQDPKKRLFDRIDAWASGWGDDPYTTAHVNARKQGIYDFSFDYRNMAFFDAVPSFANPSAPAGFDEQSFDMHRRSITPYLAFDRNSGYGNGIETWTQDANNTYPVPTMLRDSTNNYRGGLRFEYNHFHVTLEQGGTTYKDDDQAHDSTYQPGDVTTPLLGETLDLTSLNQAYGIRGSSMYSRALLTANPTSWLDVYGQFLYSEPKTDVHYAEIAGGSFLDLASLVFYSGQVAMGTGTANQPHTTSNLGFELRPFRRLRILESWMTDRYHDAASPLVAEQILLTPITVGLSTLTALNSVQYVNYNQQQVEAILEVSKRITLRGGYRYVWGDAQVLASELSQAGTMEAGQLHRNVALAGFSYRASEKLWVSLDYEGASSDNVYFRTSLNDYQKGRARARYQATKSLALQANFQVLNNRNPASDIRYDARNRANALTIFWTPNSSKWVSVMAEYDRSTLSSSIAYLTLPFLGGATSSYRDNAHTATSAVDLALPGIKGAKLTLGGSLFISAGFISAESRPTHYYQPLVRLALPIVKNVYWNTDWQYYGFADAFYAYDGFRTHIFTTGIRITR